MVHGVMGFPQKNTGNDFSRNNQQNKDPGNADGTYGYGSQRSRSATGSVSIIIISNEIL